VLTVENTLLAARRAVTLLETRRFALDVTLVRALGGEPAPTTAPDAAHG